MRRRWRWRRSSVLLAVGCILVLSLLAILNRQIGHANAEQGGASRDETTISGDDPPFSSKALLQAAILASSAEGTSDKNNNNATYTMILNRDPNGNQISFTARSSTVTIAVVNAKIHDFAYSVIAVSHGKLTSSAVLQDMVVHASLSATKTLLFTWKPAHPGDYDILVHQVYRDSLRRVSYAEIPTMVTPAPLLLRVLKKKNSTDSDASHDQEFPPCHALKNVDAFADWQGNWVGPDYDRQSNSTPRQMPGQLRTGWSFLPNNCDLQVYDKETLNAVTKPISIVILGRSVERGVFFSLLDLLLTRREKRLFEHSDIGKCWGRAQVEKRNFKITYQDVRADRFETVASVTAGKTTMECNARRVAAVSGLLKNATLMFQGLFEPHDSKSWPNVIYMMIPLHFINDGNVVFEPSEILQRIVLGWKGEDKGESAINELVALTSIFVKILPPTWNGKLVFGDMFYDAIATGMYTSQEYLVIQRTIFRIINELKRKHNETRVRWFGGMGIAKEMRLHAEFEGRIGASQHFHGFCNVNNGEMRVCSNITEMTAQFLLGQAIGETTMDLEKKYPIRAYPLDRSNVKVCSDCPAGMLPFHIKSTPSLFCQNGPLKWNAGAHAPWPQLECPCMGNEPVGAIPTQSGPVPVRVCKVQTDPFVFPTAA